MKLELQQAARKAGWHSPVDLASLAGSQCAENWVLVGRQNPIQARLEVAGVKGGQKA